MRPHAGSRSHDLLPVDAPIEKSLTSADGARLVYRVVGAGPALILIPGVMSVAAMFDPLARALAEQFTVFVLERRGRGNSAPQPPDYSMTTEIRDVEALRATSGARFVFGHSFGGLIALEYAKRCPDALARLAVYDPGVSVGGSISGDWVSRYRELLAANRPMDAFAHFSIAAGPERARRMPRWLMKRLMPLFLTPMRKHHFAALLPTVATEHVVIAALNDTWRSYAAIQAPVLLMTSGKSDLRWVEAESRALSSILPAQTTARFTTLDHFGPESAGALQVAAALRNFFGT